MVPALAAPSVPHKMAAARGWLPLAMLLCLAQPAATAPTPFVPTLQSTWAFVPSSTSNGCWDDTMAHPVGLYRGVANFSVCTTANNAGCGLGGSSPLPYNTPAQCFAYAESMGGTVAGLQYCGECWWGLISYANATANNCLTSTGLNANCPGLTLGASLSCPSQPCDGSPAGFNVLENCAGVSSAATSWPTSTNRCVVRHTRHAAAPASPEAHTTTRSSSNNTSGTDSATRAPIA